MYRRCIFCSADLGANRAIEAFPVGRTVAFDPRRGRLWAVCPRCARWNLAPIEERWEPVEAAGERFGNARLRAQSDNVGLAELPDGTRLIRVGDALPGELAAWRYGRRLVGRRREWLWAGAGAVGVAAAMGTGLGALGAGAMASVLYPSYFQWRQRGRLRRVVHRVAAERSPSGRELTVRRWHLLGGWIDAGDDGALRLHLPDVERRDVRIGIGRYVFSDDVTILTGADAAASLRRGMVEVNRSGASRSAVRDAVGMLERAGSAGGYLSDVTRHGIALQRRRDLGVGALSRPAALALEMAMHDEQERRALDGELAALETAWREAEEIAAIADALPDDPLAAFKRRSTGAVEGPAGG